MQDCTFGEKEGQLFRADKEIMFSEALRLQHCLDLYFNI